jgi:Flp pilus assembly protein TadD
VRQGQVPLAVKALARAAELSPEDAAVLNTYSVVLLKAGQNEKALEVAQRLVAIKSGDADYWDTLGQACKALGRKAEARAAFEKALAIDPKLEEARKGLEAVR